MRRIFRWIPAFIWMSVIFYLSHRTEDDLESWMPFFLMLFPWMSSFDWGHFAAYFILACTFYWGLGQAFVNIRGKLLVILMCILFGVTDEYHQSFIAGRHPDLKDIRNDGIGALLAMLFVSIPAIQRFYIRRLHSKKY
jgi:VanZ family protein